MHENGELSQTTLKWKSLDPDCDELLDYSLGLEKLISLFLILSIGVILGSFLLVSEAIIKLWKKKVPWNEDFIDAISCSKV